MSLDAIISNKHFFKAFINQIDCPLIYLSATGVIEEANHLAIKILQLNSDQYIGTNFYEFCQNHKYLLSQLFKHTKTAMQSIEETYLVKEVEYTILWKIIHFSYFSETLGGNFLIGHDMTSYKFIVEKLKSTTSFYENILSKLPTNVYWKDRNSVYLGCNERLANVMGLPSREAIKGMTDFDFAWGKAAAESFIAFDQKVMQGEVTLTTEDTFKEASGKVVTVLTSKAPLKNEAGKTIGILAISVDITEEKRLQKDLEQTKEREARFKAMATLGGMIAHELRTPLTTIGFHVLPIQRLLPQLLKGHELSVSRREVEPIHKRLIEGMKKSVDYVIRAVNYAQTTITTILEGFHYTDRDVQVKLAPFSLKRIVKVH